MLLEKETLMCMKMNSQKRKRYKVCLTGKPGVGKTSIFNIIRGKPFSNVDSATAETDMDYITVTVNDPLDPFKILEVTLQLCDTAGLDRYQSLTSSYYKDANAVVMVFSKGCSDSFSFISPLVDDIEENDYCPNSIYFLVGNKTDLSEGELQVDDETVYEFLSGKSWLFSKFMSTSAKEARGISELFNEIAFALLSSHVRPVEPKGSIAELYQQHPVNQKRFWCY